MFPSYNSRPAFPFLLILVALTATTALSQQTPPAPPEDEAQVSEAATETARPAAGVKSASVSIVLDTSRSARGSVNTLKKGALALVNQFDSGDELSLYFANDNPTLVQDFTGDTSLITGKLKRARTAGKLALFDTLSQALDHAHSDAANEQGAIVAFVSDLDGANAAAATTLENKIRQNPGVPIYLVALRKSSWKSQEVAQRIAVLSGGAAYFPTKESEVPKISQSLALRLGAVPSRSSGEEEVAQSLDGYKVLLVRSVPVADNGKTEGFLGGDDLILHRVLVSRLQKAKLFTEVRDASEMVDDGAAGEASSAGTELELLPMIVSYEGGNRKQRQFLSPFKGNSKLQVQVVLRDRGTREAIAGFVEEASGSSGLFGGSDEKSQAQAIIGVANKIVKRLRDMKREK